jgi:hypothetical protein
MALYRAIKPPDHENTSNAAYTFRPGNETNGTIDVVKDYMWTLTPKSGRKEIPYIRLEEYEVNTTTIAQQVDFYTTGIAEAGRVGSGPMGVYDGIFPKNQPTDFVYLLPFYTDINLEVNTGEWTSVDTLEAAKGGITGFASMLDPALGRLVEGSVDLATNAAGAFLALNYPKVGIMDRPKLWQSHQFRTYTIKFPLYNTYNPDPNYPEWLKNRQLCELLINQNLYNKTSFITGIPPVFYDVWIPGQHYCPAACVTNITIHNRGNIRLLKQGVTGSAGQSLANEYNVPDVYEVSLTLTDMVIPSKNLFQNIQNKQNNITAAERTTTTET